jgi:allophanate hydrolase subunit 2
MRSAMGGWQGRALKRGDQIPLLEPLGAQDLEDLALDLWSIKVYLPAALAPSVRNTIRIVPGHQWPDFTQASREALVEEVFYITPDSERMGYRLKGPQVMLTVPRQMISEATTFGTIQVPAGGQPIVLMADRQTTGGYPKIAYVASVDLPVLAQMGPGDSLRFETITLGYAQSIDAARTLAFARLAQTLAPIRTLLLNHRENHDTQD